MPALLLSTALACAGAGSNGIALLPRPAPDRAPASDYAPERPLQPVAPGVSQRVTFLAEESGYAVEVRDILVAPATKPVSLEIAGAAVIEVRDGTGMVAVGDKSRDVAIGASFAVSEGEKVTAQARGAPLLLRAHFFKVR